MTLSHTRSRGHTRVDVRPFRHDDAQPYVDLLLITSKREYSRYGRRDIACMVEHLPRSCIRVAGTKACDKAGFVTAVPEGPTLHLLLLDVRPDQQGRGIGSVLLRTIIGEARRTGKRAILCEVWDGNAQALRFYEGHGFEKAKYIYNYYQNGLSAWLMVRPLDIRAAPRRQGRPSARNRRSRPRQR